MAQIAIHPAGPSPKCSLEITGNMPTSLAQLDVGLIEVWRLEALQVPSVDYSASFGVFEGPEKAALQPPVSGIDHGTASIPLGWTSMKQILACTTPEMLYNPCDLGSVAYKLRHPRKSGTCPLCERPPASRTTQQVSQARNPSGVGSANGTWLNSWILSEACPTSRAALH